MLTRGREKAARGGGGVSEWGPGWVGVEAIRAQVASLAALMLLRHRQQCAVAVVLAHVAAVTAAISRNVYTLLAI